MGYLDKGAVKDIVLYFSVILEIIVPVIGSIFIGYFLDNYFKSNPFLTLLFLVFGVAIGVRNLIEILKRFSKDT